MTATIVPFPRLSRLPTPLERSRIASDQVRRDGGTAMDAALEAVGAAFDQYAVWWRLKATVRSAIRRGADDCGNRARYRIIFSELEFVDIDRACRVIEALYRHQLTRGRVRPGSGSIAEIRLWTRFIRRYGAAGWPAFVAEISRPAWLPPLHSLHPTAFVLDAPVNE